MRCTVDSEESEATLKIQLSYKQIELENSLLFIGNCLNNEQELTLFGGLRPLGLWVKGTYIYMYVYYLPYLTYVLDDFIFYNTPSITEVSSAFKQIWVVSIKIFEDIVLILVFWLCD